MTGRAHATRAFLMPGATSVARLEASGPRYHGDVSTPERSPSSWPQVSDYAVEPDAAVVQALLDKGNRVLVRFGDDRYRAGAEEGARELIQLLLHDRGILIDVAAQQRIAGCRDLTVLRRWAVRAARLASASQLFDEG